MSALFLTLLAAQPVGAQDPLCDLDPNVPYVALFVGEDCYNDDAVPDAPQARVLIPPVSDDDADLPPDVAGCGLDVYLIPVFHADDEPGENRTRLVANATLSCDGVGVTYIESKVWLKRRGTSWNDLVPPDVEGKNPVVNPPPTVVAEVEFLCGTITNRLYRAQGRAEVVHAGTTYTWQAKRTAWIRCRPGT